MSEPTLSPEQTAAREAAALVAVRFQLKPTEPIGFSRTRAVIEARWITWRVLADAYAWSPKRIADVTTYTSSAVAHGLRKTDPDARPKAKVFARLRKIADECLKEAAGGAP